MLALVDCRSFYCSCECVFRPDLRGLPVVVASNGDGAIVARSREAKALGIPDMQPLFKVEYLLKKHNVHVFSSNYALYGDLSNRVVSTLRKYAADIDQYSIDEQFLYPLPHLFGNTLKGYAQLLKEVVWREVRIPVEVGVASSKTLCKVANRAAKKITSMNGVCVIEREDQREWLLRRIEVGEVWGIGSRLSARLQGIGILTGWDLANANAKMLRKNFGICMERTQAELNGISCLEFEDSPPHKKQIYCSRGFGEKLTAIEPILEATAFYATTVAQKLRRQNHLVSKMQVFLQSSPFDEKPFSKGVIVEFPYPTSDTRTIVRYARQAIFELFQEGYKFKKSGVGLIELVDRNFLQSDLFGVGSSVQSEKLMSLMDSINSKFGRGTIFTAAEGTEKAKWIMQQKYKSPRYTTCWGELAKVIC